MKIREELKIILETDYGGPVRASTLNKLEELVTQAVLAARDKAQDEQARQFFGSIVDSDVGDGGGG